MHWGKTQVISVGTNEQIQAADGTPIVAASSMVYLGGLITDDGQIDSELSRRIGFAAADFKRLRQLWGHADVSRQKKLQFFSALVVSKLAYGLCTAWLTKARQRKLDGFHARCLRRILKIPAALSLS